jgi:signal transduction histidine kinase/CheY-like chemotaxis protein/HPt (histidine-containing phosphotransfer) domain-containing protein
MKSNNIRYILFAAIFLLVMPAFAQKKALSYTDSLAMMLPKVKEDTNKANILFNLSTAYFNVNTEKGISYGQQGVELATKLGWKRGLVKLNNTLGNFSSLKREYIKAVEHFMKSLKNAEEINDKRGQAIALKNIGNVYSYKIKDFQKATDYYQRCLRVAEELGDTREMADILSEMASLNHVKRDYTKALDFYQQAMGKGESAGDKRIVAENLLNISAVYTNQANYVKALEFALQSQKFYESINDKKGIAAALLKAGTVYNTQKDYTKALDNFLRSLKLAEESGKKAVIAENVQNAGDVYFSLGDHPRALQFFLRALDITEDLGDKEAMGVNLGFIGKCYHALAENKSKVQLPDSLTSLPVATRLQRAHVYLVKAIDLQKETGDFGQLEETYEVLSKVQYMEGDKDGSKESYKQHNAYLESMYNQDKSNEVARKDMQFVFNKKQETLKQESQQKEVAMQKEMQLNSLRYEYEKKQAAATSEREREQLRMEEELKQKQITYEFEQKQAGLEMKAAIAKADLEKTKALNALKQKEAKKERLFYMAGLIMLALFSISTYNRFRLLRKNKKLLEEKNKQIAAEKEIAEKLRERAENSEKFKQMFLANMSHEIRTPMNAVSGMTAILLEKTPRTDQINYLQAISKSSDVLLHIINDILDLSKIEAGKMELENIDFSLADTIQQVKDTLSHRSDEKGIQLLVDIDKKVTDVVVGDPFRLNQVLINLGGNAIKFTERGSVQFKITPEKTEGDKVSVNFSIIDTGIGIPADKINNLFGDFAQVNSSDTRKYGGTGLGLSISKQLVEMHGGIIKVESVLGSGSTFHFTLTYPKGSPEKLEQRLQQEKKADGSILNGLRILLADDNEYNRIVVNETLMLKADVKMDMVINGEEAVNAVKKNVYDVVLMDIQMPVMNGIDATIAIRTKLPESKRNVPIIALTASTLREDIDKCLQCGMNSYVPKPFKAWQLINTLADVTGRKKQGAVIPASTKKENKKEQEKADTVVAPPPPAEEGMVTDPGYLHTFCEGDEKRIKKYIVMYLKMVPAFLSKLKEAQEAKDYKEIALRIHAFKPNWLIMGMRGTGELGGKIEHQCGENNEEAIENVSVLLAQTEQSVKELEGKV